MSEGEPTLRRYARAVVPLLALLLIATASLAVSGADHRTAADRLRLTAHQSVNIMPMGDSITGSTGCWRALLWAKLRRAGHKDVDFTGRGIGPECDSIYDDDAVAYSGTRLVNLDRSKKFLTALRATGHSADIALLHLGSNDIRDDKSIGEILDGLTTVTGLLRRDNPDVVVLVARLLPMTTTPMDEDCSHCPDMVDEFNAALPDWAKRTGRDDSPVTVVDVNAGIDAEDDLSDGLHPDASGNRKIADTWFAAVDAAIETRSASGR